MSQTGGRTSTQYVLTPSPATGLFEDAALGISFLGRYAVFSVDDGGKCSALYLGEGRKLGCRGLTLASVSGANTTAAAAITGATATLFGHVPAELTLPGGQRVASVAPPQ